MAPRASGIQWYESQIYRSYHWAPEAVDSQKAIDIFRHVRLIRERDAEEKSWNLEIASAAAAITAGDAKFHTATLNRIKKLSEVGRRRMEALEIAGDSDRVRMIGSLLNAGHGEWERSAESKKWLTWLEAQGITRDEAIARSQDWLRVQLDDPFWKAGD